MGNLREEGLANAGCPRGVGILRFLVLGKAAVRRVEIESIITRLVF